MTDGQIDKAAELYRAMFARYHREFPTDLMQRVLAQPDLMREVADVFRRRVGLERGYIIFRVWVEPHDSLVEGFAIPKHDHEINRNLVKTMSQGSRAGMKELYLFQPPSEMYSNQGLISDAGVAEAYQLRSLKPVDPFVHAALLKSRPTLANDFPTVTHWQDEDGFWCYSESDLSGWHGRYLFTVKCTMDGLDDEADPRRYRTRGRYYGREIWFVGVEE